MAANALAPGIARWSAETVLITCNENILVFPDDEFEQSLTFHFQEMVKNAQNCWVFFMIPKEISAHNGLRVNSLEG